MNTNENTVTNLTYNDIIQLESLIQSIKAKKNTTPTTLKDFYSEYAKFSESYYSSKYCTSIKTAFQHLIEYMGESKMLGEIKIREIENFIGALRTTTAPRGFQVYFRTLKAAFNRAVIWEYIPENPFIGIQVPKIQETNPAHIAEKELELILRHIENNAIASLVETAFYTGCRRSELVNLRVKHVNLVDRIIIIGDDDLTTKSRKSRVIPICDKLLVLLNKLILNKKKEDYIFTKLNGYPFSGDYVSQCFKDASRKAGMSQRVHFHSLRHSFGSFLGNTGVPIMTLQKLMGHASVNTTLIYCSTNMDNLINGINAFNKGKSIQVNNTNV